MTKPVEYANQHGNRFVEELKELLRFPSISTMSEHKPDLLNAADWLKAHCESIGFTRVEVLPTGGHPVVYAEWMGAPGAPTVLVYGHYDVQPVDDPRNEWQSPPFEPTIRDGKLYARGATDDKGQAFIHLKAFEAVLKTTGTFPVNLKLMIEGEEESGSRNLSAFIEAHRDLLKADLAVISDTHVLGEDQPSIVYSLRGMVYMELEVFGPATDLHSGAFGGAVHNPAQALIEIIAKLHDEQGRITVPGFYDEVLPLTPEERQVLARINISEEQFRQETGAPHSWGDPDYTIRERLGARPTLEVCGIVGGWTGEGGKTVIPARALAKISCRLVPHQHPRRIFDLLQDYVKKLTPPTVRSELRPIHPDNIGSTAAIIPLDSRPIQAAKAAYQEVFGKEPFFQREGGSIPVVSLFQEKLGTPVLLMGFGLPDDNLHAPNEKMTLSMFHKGVQTMIVLYDHLPEALR
jgi:acetylornithine deacetylase/succinyl-diaminopimelate desuccinylase-like protein